MALVVGVTGVGIYSQVINISNLMAVLIPIGSLGITRYISEFYEDKKTAQISLLLRKILTINIPVVFIISILLIVFSRTFSQLLYSDNSYWLLITMYAVSIPLGLISSLIDIYLKSVRIVSLYVKFVAIGSITSLIVFIPLVYYYKIEGASSSFIFTYLVSIIVGLLILKKNRILPNLKVSEQLDPDVLKKIYRTGFIMIVIYMFQQLSNIVIRSLIAKSLSLHELGIYQSVYAISNNYFALFFTIIYTYSFPKFSTFKTNEEIIQETNETLKFLVLVYTPLVIIFFVFRMFFIRLLYSSEFLFAKELLFYQLLGDFLKMLSWVFAIWLIPNFKLKAWALFDIIFFVNYFCIFYVMFFYTDLGLISISVSYLISYAVHLILNFAYIKKGVKFTLTKDNRMKIVLSLAVVLLIFILARNNEILGFIAFIPVLVIWFLISVKKNEILELKSLVTGYIKNRS